MATLPMKQCMYVWHPVVALFLIAALATLKISPSIWQHVSLPQGRKAPNACHPLGLISRKNVKDMSDAEFRRFAEAVISLNRTPHKGTNWTKFEYLSKIHSLHAEHWGSNFLIWHRAFVCLPQGQEKGGQSFQRLSGISILHEPSPIY